MTTRRIALVLACVAASISPRATLRAQQVVSVWPGVAPGSERWTWQERSIDNTPLGTVVFDVVRPTLTVYLPDRAKATGTGVIIAPGGGFVALAVDVEGKELVRQLQARGIAAFLLRYRLVHKVTDGIPEMDVDTAARYGIADAIQAVKVVRQHAAEWGVAPNRIGVIGFSAGGQIVSGALLQPDTSARPNFAAFVYGPPFGKMPTIAAGLPPTFLAWAQDDRIARKAMSNFYAALMAAGNAPEVHVFSAGGHGFGTKQQGTTSDHWVDEYFDWLGAQGLTKK